MPQRRPRDKRINSFVSQEVRRSTFYVFQLPILIRQRSQSVQLTAEMLTSEDDVTNTVTSGHSSTSLARHRSDAVYSAVIGQRSNPRIEVHQTQKRNGRMGDCSDEESRCGEKSVSDLRSLFEKKITEANNGRSRSPMPGSRPLSTDNTSNSKSICNLPTPSQDEHLPPFRGRVSTAMPPDRQRDPNFCTRKTSYQPPQSSKVPNEGAVSDPPRKPSSGISNGHTGTISSEADAAKTPVSRHGSFSYNQGSAGPRRPSYPINPVTQPQTMDDATYNMNPPKGGLRKGSRTSRNSVDMSRRSTTTLPSIESEVSRPSSVASDRPRRESVGKSKFYTPTPMSPVTGRVSSHEDSPESSAVSDSCALGTVDQLSPFPEASELVEEDPYEDAPGHVSVVDLIAKFSGQSEARRQTVMQTAPIRVDLPARDSSKFFLKLDPDNQNEGSFCTRESKVKVSVSQNDAPQLEDLSEDVVVPEDHGVVTVNVLPMDNGSRRKDGGGAPQAEKNCWVKDPVVVQSGVLNGISDKERKIQESLFEILENEEMYYRSMKYVVIDHFHKKLIHKFPDASFPQFAQPLRTIFKFLGTFAEISDKLLGEIEKRRGDSPWMVPFFDILIDFVTNFMATPYKRYSVLKSRQEEELNNLRKDSHFSDVLSALNRDQRTGGLTLDAFLILPIQHATRYSLLLETVVKKLDPEDERYEPARRAHEETKAFAEAINTETNKMEYLFELTTVLAGLKNLPSNKKLESILHESKKGNQIVMFGREVSFGRTRRGVINFKQTDKLVLFAWNKYLLIVKELNQMGHFSFETLTENARALDGLEIFQELQISSFPKTVNVTKLLLIDFDPIVQGSDNFNQFLLYCSNATKKKWKQAFDSDRW